MTMSVPSNILTQDTHFKICLTHFILKWCTKAVVSWNYQVLHFTVTCLNHIHFLFINLMM